MRAPAEVLTDLVALRRPLDEALPAVRRLPWGDEEVVTLTREDAYRLLDCFLEGSVTASDCDAWANALEGRDDVAYEPGHEDVLAQLLFEVGTPEANGPLTKASARAWQRRLGPPVPPGRVDAAERDRARERYPRDEAPVVADLRAAGLDVSSLSELVNSRMDYRPQLPVLVDWLRRSGNRSVRQMLVRALTIPAARRTEAPEALLAEFEEAPDDGHRWVVGNALSVVATPRQADVVVAFFTDPAYGSGRQMLADAIGRLRPPGALDVLVAGLDDPEVAGHCVEPLGRLGDPAALPHLHRMARHPRPWIAKAARTAIARVERSAR